MNTPLSDACDAAQRAKSSWNLPADHWSVFSSGLYISERMDFVRWRLITLRASQRQKQADAHTPAA